MAIGSSFAAGPGIVRDIGAGCGRSARNYPHLLAQRLDLDLTDVTCSGATTANVLSSPQRGQPPQIDAVLPQTRLVTITVGGNDLRYGTAVAQCARTARPGESCTAVPSPAQTAAAAAKLRVDLGRVVRAAASAAPAARIYLVSYWRIFPDPPVTCPDNVISTADSVRIAEMGDVLERTYQLVAADTKVSLVDAYAASAGRDVCAGAGERWVEGSRTTGVQYHPNAMGMAAVSRLVEKAVVG